MTDIFHELFVLEVANNHCGDVARGFDIIRRFAAVVHQHKVRAAIKLQFRDVDTFIHTGHRNDDTRYIKKTLATQMPWTDYRELVRAIKSEGCLAAATPFDERSVEKCVEFDVDIIKVSSSDINDWPLVDEIAKTEKPVIGSTGGASQDEVDAFVHTVCRPRPVPLLALNHCVSLYPSKDGDLSLNQIDVLRHRYPGFTIGFSTHECGDWSSSMLLSYAKGARTWERHIDLFGGEHPLSAYCSTPHQIGEWFRAFHKAKEMCGGDGWRPISPPETAYLRSLKRGVYAKRDLPIGHRLVRDDVYFAIPLQPDQADCSFQFGYPLVAKVRKDEPVGVFNAALRG